MRFSDLLFTPVCVECGKEGTSLCSIHDLNPLRTNSLGRCERCWFFLVRGKCPKCSSQEVYFDSHRSLFPYEGTIRALIHRWKFENERHIVQLFLPFLRDALAGLIVDRACVISGGKRSFRSFFPCNDLLRVCKLLKIPFGTDLRKKRIGKNKKQSHRNQAGRYFEIRDSLRVVSGISGVENYVVLDDVFTTGATANEAARILKSAGAKKVHILTLAMREELELPI
ncbi:MAG: ComF family protein [Leptospirales bacterium]|nr:ComF family protein [Leptospirales bacterium]